MKSLKPSDYDLICVVIVDDPRVQTSLLLDYSTQLCRVDMLVRYLMERHITFTVRYYDPSDDYVSSHIASKINFVYGLILLKDKLISRPVID